MTDQADLFGDTLSLARDQWRETIRDKGGTCPCCDRWGKVYPRSINRTMAKSLIWLSGRGWVNVAQMAPRWLVRSNQLPTLRWWSMIERDESDDPAKKHSGNWRTTQRGDLFAAGFRKAPKTVYTYNAQVIEFSEETISIVDCFDSRFHYQDVMNAIRRGEVPR